MQCRLPPDVARASRPLWRGHPARARCVPCCGWTLPPVQPFMWLLRCGSETLPPQRARRPRYKPGSDFRTPVESIGLQKPENLLWVAALRPAVVYWNFLAVLDNLIAFVTGAV